MPGISVEQVVTEGLCVGCGACAAVEGSAFTMQLNDLGLYEPVRRADEEPSPSADDAAAAVCPFAGWSLNEDEIAAIAFPDVSSDPRIGRHRQIRAAHVAIDDYRERGTSGGMTSWFIAELFRLDLIDAAIHVRPQDPADGAPLFTFDVSHDADEARSWVKSRYHVVEMSEAIAVARATPGRYAFVGVPCFVRSVRSLMREDAVLAERIAVTASLVCGHLKSTRYAEYLAWELGVPPGGLEEIDFRLKMKGRPANRYAVEVKGTDAGGHEVDVERGVEFIKWSDWGIGLLKVPACDYCDDVVGETADITFGDAWIAPYLSEHDGTNLVITRSKLAESVVAGGIERGEVAAKELTAEDAARSQKSGLSHRREGLAIRLANRERTGRYVPTKRVTPNPDGLETPDGIRTLARERVSIESHVRYAEARTTGDLEGFFREMKPAVVAYQGSASKALRSQLRQRVERWMPDSALQMISKGYSKIANR